MGPHSMDSKQFNVRLKGYDQVQVDGFLDSVQASWRADRFELERLRGATRELPKVAPGLSVDQIAKLMDTAKLTADAEVADAKQAAIEIVEQAKREAAVVVAAATEEKHKEIGRLEEQRVQLQQRVDELNDTHDRVHKTLRSALGELEA